jgi:ABC-type transport system involved in multi-copper enzyme maturation permease subunit
MMLCYKAWRESRTRFLLSAFTLAGLCAALVWYHREAGDGISRLPLSYVDFIWKAVYRSYIRELFVLLVLLLGVGGLLREKAARTTGFTLALPVSRWRLVATRAAVGVLEVMGLSLVPALVIPALSPVVHQSYPWAQALQFSLLWSVCGTLIFMMAFLPSALFGEEYTAPVVSFFVLLAYSFVADIPAVERHLGDIHDLMSGEGMPYFRPETAQLAGPLPWLSLAMILVISASVVVVAASITRQQDF